MTTYVHGCTGKRKYGTADLAARGGRPEGNESYAAQLNVYQCPSCTFWHRSHMTAERALSAKAAILTANEAARARIAERATELRARRVRFIETDAEGIHRHVVVEHVRRRGAT